MHENVSSGGKNSVVKGLTQTTYFMEDKISLRTIQFANECQLTLLMIFFVAF